MKTIYIKPNIKNLIIDNENLLSESMEFRSNKKNYNNVGNYGPGDKVDDDRQNDDNWDKDWSWD